MVTLDNLGKKYNGKWAVRGLNLEIPAGEIFGLLGPNAAGKTTTIRMIIGLLMPSEGRAVICGHDVEKDPISAKSFMGYVPDRPFFYEKLTSREFLVFLASIRSMEKEYAIGRIDDVVELFGLGDFQNEMIEGYSQGMKQRVAFAGAVLHKPPVLLIDEPFVGLDPFGVILIKEIIKSIAKSGSAIVLATHSLHIASELCDRVGLINKGALTALKTREEITKYDGGLEGMFITHADKTGR